MRSLAAILAACAFLSAETNTNIPAKPSLSISNRVEITAYARFTDVVEQTGNEDTFGAYLRDELLVRYQFTGWSVGAFVDATLNEQLSLKARFYESMNPPAIALTSLAVFADLGTFGVFTFGAMRPLTYHLPMRSYQPPVLYRTLGGYQTLVTGRRDVPIMYNIITEYDTGLAYRFSWEWFTAAIAVVNGEEGLDSASGKTGAFDLGVSNKWVNAGVSGQIELIGSVPIKEYHSLFTAHCYVGDTIRVGIDGMVLMHGLRDETVNPFDTNSYQMLISKYHYTPGFFSPFTLPNLDAPGAPLWGYAVNLFAEAAKLWDMVSLTAHIGIYDPNWMSDSRDIYKIKSRGFLRAEFFITENFSMLLSYMRTYDEVFLAHYQFYEVEPRSVVDVNGNIVPLHYTIDQDLFLAAVFRF
ncbi:MAG: hypothetical protein AABZ39_18460 [Spirochaetota bacterium]